jgi:predicted SPOUT superfamily RNA methylase MTH1
MDPDLQYVGLLPPLRTPHHPIIKRKKKLHLGEYREGVILLKKKDKTLVDIGIEKPVTISGSTLSPNTRVTVKIIRLGKKLKIKLVDPIDIKIWWGYKIEVAEGSFLKILNQKKFDLSIATSRLGDPFVMVKDEIIKCWNQSLSVLVAFGSSKKGLFDIIKNEGKDLRKIVDFVVNMIPHQAVETVRTEEAIFTSLGIMNLFTI